MYYEITFTFLKINFVNNNSNKNEGEIGTKSMILKHKTAQNYNTYTDRHKTNNNKNNMPVVYLSE